MLILGLETATEQVSVAIGGHEGVLGLFEVCRGRRHAELLTPGIEMLCRQADVELSEISVVASGVTPPMPSPVTKRHMVICFNVSTAFSAVPWLAA